MSVGRYQAYPEYKPTGADWLTSVPESWSVFDGKRIFESCRDPALSSDEQLASSQKFGVIPQSLMMELNDAKVMLALKGTSSFRHVEKNDYVISLRSFEGGIEYSGYTGCVSPAYTVLRPTKPIASGFYKHLFKSRPYISALQATTDSLRDGKAINYEQFGAIPLILPPLPEQTQIAAFLDHETAKIDRLIEQQQALISLLKEKRQAVISHAVTKGLNPYVPLKDSGIEWLGQVPAHWEVSYIKYNATLAGRIGFRGYTTEDLVDEGAGAITLSPSNFDGGNLTFEKKTYISWRKYHESPEIKLQAEDIVMVKTGSTLGKIGFVDQVSEPMTINPQVVIFKNVELRPRFLFFFLGSPLIQSNVKISNTGGTMPTMTQECIGNYPVLVPSKEEQESIVANLTERCGKIDVLLERTVSALTLLQERRTALISAAVTGKIDVHHWRPTDNAA